MRASCGLEGKLWINGLAVGKMASCGQEGNLGKRASCE